MANFRRCVLGMTLAVFCGALAFAQPHTMAGSDDAIGNSGASSEGGAAGASTGAAVQIAPSQMRGVGFFHGYGIGTYESPLGFGGRIATSLSRRVNLRAGASFFSFSTSRQASGIPFTANVRFQSEEAQVDWYPFHGTFHLSPGVMFGNSSRVYGSALIPAGNSFTLNDVNYYSGAANPVHASGSVRFRRAAPMLTLGWGNWVRHEREGHWIFPFEAGAVFWGAPKTALDFSGQVCSDPGQHFCQDITKDPSVQANVDAERTKLQNGANWLKVYPVIAGGIVYRF